MASRTAGGSPSAAPAPSTSRTTAGVTTSGARAPGGRRASACRQTRASFAFSSVTPASSVWPRITSRTDDRSKRTTPADAAVRHASAGAPKHGAPADSASSSAGDDTSRSTTTIGTGPSGPAAGDGAAGSGASHAADPGTLASNGRFSRCRSAMASFSCSV